MRIAYFTPVSPQRTGIADYSERELIPYLSKHVDLDIFIDENIVPTNAYLKENSQIYCYKEYERRKDNYDIAFYHMGSNRFHGFIYESLLKDPGITAIHDVYMYGFFYYYCLNKGNINRFKEEFGYCYGDKGLELAEKHLRGEASPEYDYALTRRVIDNSLGIVCHSNFGIRKILSESKSPPITKIDHPFTVSNEIKAARTIKPDDLRPNMGLKGRFPVITSFGFIFKFKRYDVLLKVFKRFLRAYSNAILFLVGEDGMNIGKQISELGLEGSVVVTGYVPRDMVLKYLAVSDFCINLRYPTSGETSGSVLHIMAMGKPAIISNVGWFSEVPGDTCLKVDVDAWEEVVLLEYMKILASNEALRDAIGRNAKDYIARIHDPEKIAIDYYSFIKGILCGDEAVLDKLSSELIDIGVEEDDAEVINYVLGKAI